MNFKLTTIRFYCTEDIFEVASPHSSLIPWSSNRVELLGSLLSLYSRLNISTLKKSLYVMAVVLFLFLMGNYIASASQFTLRYGISDVLLAGSHLNRIFIGKQIMTCRVYYPFYVRIFSRKAAKDAKKLFFIEAIDYSINSIFH
jgi:hypothetical protein